ncbi:cobalamin-independent methionine synthase II family protein [Microbacterium kunmingense]|uniref:cobalamin-independent methionine synthase II family protein n=1 Tax=Microbacterium kunmingense TaxID=2915939 RepID=UPI002004C226|nr:cobalamin-independent methionine synthase II family protein [Microbacterium kunmingense]
MVEKETEKEIELSEDQLRELVTEAVDDVVGRQVDLGLDIVSDGEMSKIGYSTYVKERLTGFDGEAGALELADLADYPELLARSLNGLVTTTPACTGPISYNGQVQLQHDLDAFTAALQAHHVPDAFIPAASPGVIAIFLANQYYESQQDYLAALADAMAVEYRAIVDAGFILQIDCPDLAMGRHIGVAPKRVDDFIAEIELNVVMLNRALEGIDPTRVRVHLCWGNYEAPHHHDIDLVDILPTVLKIQAQGIVLEASNPRHSHEWRVFEKIRLPEDKVLIVGVIDTSSNYIEHPAVVAERITRYASVVGRERVIAATDCGFATFASFLPVEPRIAWAKLASLTEGARLASHQLW